VHLFTISFEETTAACQEESVSSEDAFMTRLILVGNIETDGVLGMTWSRKCPNSNVVSDGEFVAVLDLVRQGRDGIRTTVDWNSGIFGYLRTNDA
jgi:hypothetical protein